MGLRAGPCPVPPAVPCEGVAGFNIWLTECLLPDKLLYVVHTIKEMYDMHLVMGQSQNCSSFVTAITDTPSVARLTPYV